MTGPSHLEGLRGRGQPMKLHDHGADEQPHGDGDSLLAEWARSRGKSASLLLAWLIIALALHIAEGIVRVRIAQYAVGAVRKARRGHRGAERVGPLTPIRLAAERVGKTRISRGRAARGRKRRGRARARSMRLKSAMISVLLLLDVTFIVNNGGAQAAHSRAELHLRARKERSPPSEALAGMLAAPLSGATAQHAVPSPQRAMAGERAVDAAWCANTSESLGVSKRQAVRAYKGRRVGEARHPGPRSSGGAQSSSSAWQPQEAGRDDDPLQAASARAWCRAFTAEGDDDLAIDQEADEEPFTRGHAPPSLEDGELGSGTTGRIEGHDLFEQDMDDLLNECAPDDADHRRYSIMEDGLFEGPGIEEVALGRQAVDEPMLRTSAGAVPIPKGTMEEMARWGRGGD